MKIAIVTNLYPPYARGGAEVVITRTVTELLARGHEVIVVTSKPFGGFSTLTPKLETTATEQVYRFFPLNVYHSLRDNRHPALVRLCWHLIDMFNPLNGYFVRQVMKHERPDVIWTHNLKGIGLTIPLFLRGLGIPHVHQVHDVQLSVPSGLIIAGREKGACCMRIGRWIYTQICRLLFDSPTLVISPSKFLKEFYEARGFFCHSEVTVMPNPAPIMASIERTVRQNGPLRLLFVGQLEEHKGIRFLMDGLEKLEIPWELSIAGEGSIGKWVKDKARQDKRTIYVGYLAMTQLIKLFEMADALVVPSLCYENSPTVIYEALEAGLPVVASDIGGVAELIQEGVNGYLFAAGEREDLLSTLRTLDAQKERLWANSGAVRATIAPYAMHRYVDDLTELFEGLRRVA